MSEDFLREHQKDAVMKMRNGCILNGTVGSGKSRTALYYYFKENGGDRIGTFRPMFNPQDLYIITTAQKRDNSEWDYELALYAMSQDPDVNYYNNKIVIDSWNNIKKYADINGAFFIFDEDKVTGKGVWVKTFLRIAKNNNWIILSATPGDTWMDYAPVFIANGFFRNRSEFLREHVIFSRYTNYPKVDRYLNTGRLIRLRRAILIDMDFKRKTVPHHETILVDYDKLLYKQISKTRQDPVTGEPFQNASSYCYALRRVINTDDSRLDAVLDLVHEKNKVIIFYNFDYELELLKSLKYGDEYEVAEWNGHKHEELPSGEYFVYLTQYAAGCEGWNCIRTDTIIFYSQNYSYKVMTQAAGRIDRMNTPYTDLYYYHLKSHASLDLAIAKALSDKKKFNEMQFAIAETN